MKRIIVAMRGRYKSGGGTAQQLEPQFSGLCNTLTSVQKDNLILEIDDVRECEDKASHQGGNCHLESGGVADLSFPTSKTRRGRVQGDGEICPTLMANNQDIFKLEADEVKKYRIRKLTPKECWRLMGFSDEDFEKAAAVNSNTQLYAQAGNSIVVNVLEAIFGEMIEPEAKGEEIEDPQPERCCEEQYEVIEQIEEGNTIELPMAAGSDVWVVFRGIVLKCEVTYWVIYPGNNLRFELAAYDQSPLKTETADLIFLWNNHREQMSLSDIGTKVFLNEEDAKRAASA